MSDIAYTRISGGKGRGSRIERNQHIELHCETVLPGPPVEVSPVEPCHAHAFLEVPPGYTADWSPTPGRQWMLLMRGDILFEVEDSQSYWAGAGDLLLLEDTEGRGHRIRVLGNRPALLSTIQL